MLSLGGEKLLCARWSSQHQNSMISHNPHNNTRRMYSCFAPLRNRELRLRDLQSWPRAIGQAAAGQTPTTVDSDPDIYSLEGAGRGRSGTQIVRNTDSTQPCFPEEETKAQTDDSAKPCISEGRARMTMQVSNPPVQRVQQLKSCVLTLGLCRLTMIKSCGLSLLLLIFLLIFIIMTRSATLLVREEGTHETECLALRYQPEQKALYHIAKSIFRNICFLVLNL